MSSVQSNGSGPPSDAARESPGDGRKLAELLGWASLGLGAVQTSSPGRFDRLIGVEPDPKPRAVTVLACGLRELAAGVGILALERPHPARWLWARVAGDALDLALLGQVLRTRPARPERVVAAIGMVVGITAADVYAAARNSRRRTTGSEEGPMELKAQITVARPAEEVYAFWRNLENLPRFMFHLDSVETTDGGRSRWKAKAPIGSVKWEAEVTEDRPGELIAWRSVGSPKVTHSGRVRFAPAPRGQGTEIRLEMRYDAPGGALGAALAKVVGEEPRQQVKDDLRRFKQVMETGEVIRSEGTPEGQTARRILRQRPAQPPDREVAKASEKDIERSYV